MSKADVRKAIDIAPNKMTRMRNNQVISMAILIKICDKLDCDFGDIVVYVKN